MTETDQRMLRHAGTDDKLAEELERLRISRNWRPEENRTLATAVRVLRELNAWRILKQTER